VEVQLDRAQAPVVVLVPLLAAIDQVGPVTLRGLEVLRPDEHALVPVHRSRRHGGTFPVGLHVSRVGRDGLVRVRPAHPSTRGGGGTAVWRQTLACRSRDREGAAEPPRSLTVAAPTAIPSRNSTQ